MKEEQSPNGTLCPGRNSGPTEQTGAELSAEEELLLAKIHFLRSAENFSAMSFVQRRPLTSVGIAFILGVALAVVGRSRRVTPVISSLAELSTMASQWVPLLAKRARSSGG